MCCTVAAQRQVRGAICQFHKSSYVTILMQILHNDSNDATEIETIQKPQHWSTRWESTHHHSCDHHVKVMRTEKDHQLSMTWSLQAAILTHTQTHIIIQSSSSLTSIMGGPMHTPKSRTMHWWLRLHITLASLKNSFCWEVCMWSVCKVFSATECLPPRESLHVPSKTEPNSPCPSSLPADRKQVEIVFALPEAMMLHIWQWIIWHRTRWQKERKREDSAGQMGRCDWE